MAIKRVSELDRTTAAELSAQPQSLFEVSLQIPEALTNELPSYYKSRAVTLEDLAAALGVDNLSAWVDDIVNDTIHTPFKFNGPKDFDDIVCNGLSAKSNVRFGPIGSDKVEQKSCNAGSHGNVHTGTYETYTGTGLSCTSLIPTYINNTLQVEGAAEFHDDLVGVALSACWADLAEQYASDSNYEPGTLVKFGGEQEITLASDGEVNAVISTKPGLVIGNANVEHTEGVTYKMIALTGRVPVKVKGKVKKFEKIYLSDEPGIGIAGGVNWSALVGRALKSKDTDGIGLVECVVQLSLD